MITHGEHTIEIQRRTPAPPALTRSVCEGAVAFGLTLDDLRPHTPTPERCALTLPPGAIALVEGPSGSGKSSLLRDAEESAEASMDAWTVVRPPRETRGSRACVDRVPGRDTSERLRWLARAGLAEARAALRAPGALSTGERERLRLAIAIARADLLAHRHQRVLLIVDELGAGLDHATSTSVASSLARFVRANERVRLLCATNRPELARALRPSISMVLDGTGRLEIRRACRVPHEDRFLIEPGTREDLEALARHHYRPGAPATIAGVLRAVERTTGARAGVLCASMPTLNASWRRVAWDDRFSTPDKRTHALTLNAQLRCLSRVIVAPEHRACGLAVRLVRAYLADPITPCTEAIASMGRSCPFFERAGMSVHEPPVPARDARLLDALEHAGVRQRWRFATPGATLLRAIDGAGRPFVEREVRRWASDGRSSAAHADAPIEALFERACRRLASSPLVYTHIARRDA